MHHKKVLNTNKQYSSVYRQQQIATQGGDRKDALKTNAEKFT